VEIYEGDIIEDFFNDNWHIVTFRNGTYCGQFVAHGNICGGYNIESMHKLDVNFKTVIGNIYENPVSNGA